MLAANGFSPEQHAVLDLGPRLFLHHRLRHGHGPSRAAETPRSSQPLPG